MIHYNCDMCGKSLVPEEDDRYVVKIEIYAACDSMEVDDDDLIDDFEEDGEEEEEEDEVDNIDPEEMDGVEYKTFRYDLCSKCHSRYMQDPLSINSIRRGRFSEN
jgi:DNA-directed RNA polymerase subunit M/transcription elongation factor TFIIS